MASRKARKARARRRVASQDRRKDAREVEPQAPSEAPEAAATAERRRWVGRGIGYALAIAALAAVAVSIFALAGGIGTRPSPEDFPPGSVPPRQVSDLQQAVQAAGCTVKSFQSEGNDHVGDDPDYQSSPPHSGNHAATPADDGAYSEAPRTGAVVHALEHGRVVYWFRPNAQTSLKGALKALFDEDDRHLLLVPAEAPMRYEVAASAWTRVLGCPNANRRVFDALRAFRDAYRDKGPESMP